MSSNLVLCRSDAGDGGWSLHVPGSTDEQIASGDHPPLLSGTAEKVNGEWSRPDWDDYIIAAAYVMTPKRAFELARSFLAKGEKYESFDSFVAVMWSADDDRIAGVTREEYQDLLRAAFNLLGEAGLVE